MTPLSTLLAGIIIITIITIIIIIRKNKKQIANKEIATCFQATAQLEDLQFPYGFRKARQLLSPSLVSSEVTTNAPSSA